jgi:uncharacterized protein (DUF305 family)
VENEAPEFSARAASGHGPRPWQVVALGVALCFLAGVIGWWIAQPDDPSFNPVDVGFLSDMETHHRGAIELGFTYLGREHDSLVGHFAREIVLGQSQELAVMNSLLGETGSPASTSDDVAMEWMGHAVAPAQMPGMASDADVEELRAAQGLDADDRFTRLMIVHHAAGVTMAQYAAEHGENAKVRQLAASMARVQRTEIIEMNNRREELGLAPVTDAEIRAVLDVEGHSHAH